MNLHGVRLNDRPAVHKNTIELLEEDGAIQCMDCGQWTTHGRAVLEQVPCVDDGDALPREVLPQK